MVEEYPLGGELQKPVDVLLERIHRMRAMFWWEAKQHGSGKRGDYRADIIRMHQVEISQDVKHADMCLALSGGEIVVAHGFDSPRSLVWILVVVGAASRKVVHQLGVGIVAG